MALIEKITLSFKQGSSDKFYVAAIEEVDGGYMVPFTFGRTGTSGQSGSKTSSPVPLDKAKKIYDKVVAEKKGKGYQIGLNGGSVLASSVSSVSSPQKGNTGIMPQLLCPILDDEIEKYLSDPRYGAQEKKDGRRKFMQRESGKNISFNRKGQAVGYPICFDDPCEYIANNNQVDSFLIDGEEIGDTFHYFDLLSFGSTDYRTLSYRLRHAALVDLIDQGALINAKTAFNIVPLAVTEKEKRELYEQLKKENKEGIVFKLLDAPYTEGRPSETFVSYSQACPQVKFKFYVTVTCIVLKQNAKRSVQLGLYDENYSLIPVGNCTIPPNKDIPAVDDLVEIRYLYAYKGGSLYQPTYLIPRDDIEVQSCVTAKLKYKAE